MMSRSCLCWVIVAPQIIQYAIFVIILFPGRSFMLNKLEYQAVHPQTILDLTKMISLHEDAQIIGESC